MKTITKTIAIAAFAALATPIVATAEYEVPTYVSPSVPGVVNYQGRLIDTSTGEAYVDGIYQLDIRLYDAVTGGTFLWGGRYSAYVKNGYFNLMLGDTAGAVDLAEPGKYLNQDLWRALWPQKEPGYDDTTRYLEVTPLQDSLGRPISSPVAITPRQQLLTSPFALRAQMAQAANEALGDFSVAGNLSVNGSIDARNSTGTQYFGPISTTASSVKLTGEMSATSSSPEVYDVGKKLFFYSYNDMVFKATSGNMTFTTVSGKSMTIDGQGEFKSTAAKNTIGGTGATAISGSSVSVDASGIASMKGGSYARIESNSSKSKGSTSYVQASPTSVAMSDVGSYGVNGIYIANSNVNVTASKAVNVSAKELTLNSACEMQIGSEKPFVIKEVSVTIAANSSYKDYVLSNDSYRYVVIGYNRVSGAAASLKEPAFPRVLPLTDGRSTVRVTNPTTYTTDSTIKVQILGIHKKLSTESRGTLNAYSIL